MSIRSMVEVMRGLGIRSLEAPPGKPFQFYDDDSTPIEIVKVELFLPIVAPAVAFEPDEPAPEEKPPGICVHPGCGEKNGWQFARDYCRDHGLAAAGVTRAR